MSMVWAIEQGEVWRGAISELLPERQAVQRTKLSQGPAFFNPPGAS